MCRRISASTYTLVVQTKILFTAVNFRLLGQKLSYAKWRALCTLLCAVVIICYNTKARPKECSSSASGDGTPGGSEACKAAIKAAAPEFMLGVSAAVLEAFLSGFATVYFETMLKSATLSLWERNVQLSCFAFPLYVAMTWMWNAGMWNAGEWMRGWSACTWLVIVIGATGGILTGLVIQCCNSVIKTGAVASAIVVTTLSEYLCFGGPMNVSIVAGAACVILAVISYACAE